MKKICLSLVVVFLLIVAASVSAQEGKCVEQSKIIGTWQVYNVTAAFPAQDAASVAKTMQAIESGATKLEDLLKQAQGETKGNSLKVTMRDITAAGEMLIRVDEPLFTGEPVTTHIKIKAKWKLVCDKIVSQWAVDSAEFKVTLNDDNNLSRAEKKVYMKSNREAETQGLASLKNAYGSIPPWTEHFLYISDLFAVTKDANGNVKLMYKKR